MKTFRIYLWTSLVGLVNLQKPISRPNIVLIIADDVGWNDVGFHGSDQIPTPNIDALAYNGMILNRFYTLPSCTPSRAALLTGKYPIRFGFQGIPMKAGEHRHIPLNIATLPEKLRELGYATHLVGKWHLGAAFKNATPTSRGFDSHFGYWNGYIGYFDHQSLNKDMIGFDMHENHTPAWHTQGQYATGLFTKRAEKIIRSHDESKPLFLMVSHLAAHSGKNGVDLEVPNIAENDKKFGCIADPNRRLFAGMMHELDESVGQVVESLSKKGILDNTIIIFLSDNGAQTVGIHYNVGSNWPLRGLKLSIFDGGIRTCAIVYTSKMKKKGTVNNELVHVSDLFPSIYAAAGGNIHDLGEIDGVNQWSLLASNEKSTRSEMLVNIDEKMNSSGIIGENGRYKLVNGSTLFENYDDYYGEDGRGHCNSSYRTFEIMNSLTNVAIGGNLSHESITKIRSEASLSNCRPFPHKYDVCKQNVFCLFDLFDDPCESTNIADKFPEILSSLVSKLAKYWAEMLPQKNTSIDPKSNPIYYNNSWYTWLDDNFDLLMKYGL